MAIKVAETQAVMELFNERVLVKAIDSTGEILPPGLLPMSLARFRLPVTAKALADAPFETWSKRSVTGLFTVK